MSLLDPECTVVQIETLRNKEEVGKRKMMTNDNYMKISEKEKEREEEKKNKNKRKEMVKVKEDESGRLCTRRYENKHCVYALHISPLFKKSSLRKADVCLVIRF
jgi:hypothetical protein